MKKIFIILLVTTMSTATYAQGLVNNGAHIVVSSGATLTVDGSSGNVQNTSGVIDLSGTLQLDGNLTNNAPTNALGTPTSGSTVVFAGTGTQAVGGSSTAIFTFDKLTVNSGAALEMAAGKQLTCNGSLVNNGTFTLKTNTENATATLLDNGFSGTGTNKVELYLSSGRNWYVSSPVSGATSSVFNTNASYPMYAYNESNTNTTPWTWITDDQTNLNVMTGYISSVQTSGIYTFTGGLINTGDKSFILNRTVGQAKDGFNLVGNPYPSYVDLHAAIRTNLIPTYWYRSKNDVNTAYVFETYNLISELGTSLSGKSMTNYIPPMQAFWIRVDAGCTSGNIDFTNALRSHQDISNNKFRAPTTAGSLLSVLRLKITNGTNSDETIVLFNPNASDGYDAYDSPKMSNANAAIPEIYTVAGSEQAVINGLNSIETNTIIPLGFRTGQPNSFSIMATELSNFTSDTRIVLKDNVLNTEQDLASTKTYSFTSDIVDNADRFSLIFKSTSLTTSLNNSLKDKSIIVYKNANHQIVLKCADFGANEHVAKVFNILGKELFVSQITSYITQLGNSFIPGVYMVTVTSEGKMITKKIVID